MSQQLDIRVAIGHLFRVDIQPVEHFLIWQIRVHPSQSCLIFVHFTPITLRLDQLLQQRGHMIGLLRANAEILNTALLRLR